MDVRLIMHVLSAAAVLLQPIYHRGRIGSLGYDDWT